MSEVTTGEPKYLLSFPLKYRAIKGGEIWANYVEHHELGLNLIHYPKTRLRDECWVVRVEFLDVTIEGRAPTERIARQRARRKLKEICDTGRYLLDRGPF